MRASIVAWGGAKRPRGLLIVSMYLYLCNAIVREASRSSPVVEGGGRDMVGRSLQKPRLGSCLASVRLKLLSRQVSSSENLLEVVGRGGLLHLERFTPLRPAGVPCWHGRNWALERSSGSSRDSASSLLDIPVACRSSQTPFNVLVLPAPSISTIVLFPFSPEMPPMLLSILMTSSAPYFLLVIHLVAHPPFFLSSSCAAIQYRTSTSFTISTPPGAPLLTIPPRTFGFDSTLSAWKRAVIGIA